MARFISFALSIFGGILVAGALERLAGFPWLIARCLGGVAVIALYVVLYPRLTRRSRR